MKIIIHKLGLDEMELIIFSLNVCWKNLCVSILILWAAGDEHGGREPIWFDLWLLINPGQFFYNLHNTLQNIFYSFSCSDTLITKFTSNFLASSPRKIRHPLSLRELMPEIIYKNLQQIGSLPLLEQPSPPHVLNPSNSKLQQANTAPISSLIPWQKFVFL